MSKFRQFHFIPFTSAGINHNLVTVIIKYKYVEIHEWR
ncbi:hypothetical protein BROSI_A3130 [Candidatus Brocadia sinica JPN1]|uniref:Uncharacterized protein n=1 Tax=Candidatus Brocadia sinica JPN1 TaxID=1197129 RepID=A0ABQ0K0L0_9BACT|nr:hypothetical protein BROSI_A3130 [Candidatus Brocadia sinica JPN1]